MSDQWPQWSPPGDTDQADGGDPPPPPPPSSSPPPPPPPGISQTTGWQPPPRSTSRTGLVIGILVGAIVLFGGSMVALLVAATDAPEAAQGDGEPAPDRADDLPVDADEVPANDVVAQTEAILQTIDASELRMITFGQDMAANLEEDGSLGAGAEAISREAVAAGDDLTSLRSELRALAGGEGDRFDGLRDVRDGYAQHMQAWIDYADAVAGSPALAVDGSADAEPFMQDINDTGDDFVAAVQQGLPSDIPAELRRFADFIVQRGFTGPLDEPSGELV